MFKLFHSKIKPNGVIVETYNPTKEIYIDAFNMKTGKKERCRVINFTVHKNVDLYLIKSLSGKFEEFYGTADHGYIVYDPIVNEYKKVNLKELLKNKLSYKFVKVIGDETIHIDISDLIANKTSEKIAYDFTVEKHYTFLINDGLAVYDTMAVYSSLLPKSNDDLKNILDPILQIHPGKWLYLIDELITGLYNMTFNEPNPNKIIDEFENVHEFIERCKDKSFLYLIENYSKTVSIGKNVNTVGRSFMTSILKPKSKINKPLNKPTVQYYLTRLYYNLVALPIINKENKYSASKKRLEFQKLVNIVVRTASKVMNGLPISLHSLLNGVEDIIDDYYKKLEDTMSGKENDVLIEYKKKLELKNNRYSGENKLTKVVDQMLLSRGFVENYDGKKIFIRNSYMKGLSDVELFNSAQSNRNGAVSKVISVSDAGYLYRKLVFCTSHITADTNRPDFCGTDRLLLVHNISNNDLFKYYLFRNVVIDNIEYKIDFETIPLLANKYKNEIADMYVYSPMYCKEEHFCKKCVPIEYTYFSNFVGILSSQCIGEHLSQDLMRQFHTGGKVDSGINITNDYIRVDGDKLFANDDIEIDSIELDDTKENIVIKYTTKEKMFIIDTISDIISFNLEYDNNNFHIKKDELILTFEQTKKKTLSLVKSIDRALLRKNIDHEELFSLIQQVDGQSFYKEMIVQAMYYDKDYKPSRMVNYENESRKYSTFEIPYFNRITGLCFANLNMALKKQSFENVIDSVFFSSILTGNTYDIKKINER